MTEPEDNPFLYEKESDDVLYEVEVTVKFRFDIMAEDDFQAENIAIHAWQQNLYHSEVQDVRFKMVEEEE